MQGTDLVFWYLGILFCSYSLGIIGTPYSMLTVDRKPCAGAGAEGGRVKGKRGYLLQMVTQKVLASP